MAPRCVAPGGFAAWMARQSCNVREPWPVPASNISTGDAEAVVGAVTWMSRRETMVAASRG